MKRPTYVLALSLFFFATGAVNANGPSAANTISPAEAVKMAASAAPKAVPGTFELHVRAGERDPRAMAAENGFINLYSERDFRQPQNLTIAISPAVAEQLTARLGLPPHEALKNKRILVSGAAQYRSRAYSSGGEFINWVETRVVVTDIKQIQVKN